MSFTPVDVATAAQILDFSGGDPGLESLGQLQLEGAVALHNMIVDPKVGLGYLADEVGMGKTYVALGVVSLMRYFNPSLRVLFICPSHNVQKKWFDREYRSFTKQNVKVNQYRIRTPDGRPAAPRISCRNVPELIRAAASGYYADFFVGMGAFSMGLAEDKSVWAQKLRELEEILPAQRWDRIAHSKMDTKEKYAKALNYVLPTFDLVVIDEAHNFKHNFQSSDRNFVLSGVLGFRGQKGYHPRVNNALLLSATPYDRDINQLRNQLLLVGKGSLLPDDLANDEKDRLRRVLSRFLVRRLNELKVAGSPRTRNMYRREWRSGERAEVSLKSDEQKLVTALVQKKVGEMLTRKDGKPSFQTGLLASFESYAESTKSPAVEFDGDPAERSQTDAEDKHVIAAIQESFVAADLGRTLPHPKMDVVAAAVAREIFERGRKQIVFVRRVKSVKEIKDKLDDHYNEWLITHIRRNLEGHPLALVMMEQQYKEYTKQSRRRDGDIAGGEFNVDHAGEAEDNQPPSNDNFFTWFFRGATEEHQTQLLKVDGGDFTSPDLMRRGLAARNQVISSLLEINWAREICLNRGENLHQLVDQHGAEIARYASEFTTGQDDNFEWFHASQLGFMAWYGDTREIGNLRVWAEHLHSDAKQGQAVTITTARVAEYLDIYTLFDAIEEEGLSHALIPLKETVLTMVMSGADLDWDSLRTFEIHCALIALCLRTGHGVVDMYLARLRMGHRDLAKETRAAWMSDLASQLSAQSQIAGFSTYNELQQLADQLPLVIKCNLPEAFDKSRDEYRYHFSVELNPVAPIVGASGATVGSRSAQARKFRMPGYPLALVSTDVFQEGEDLHTFCDSVVHYGLSGSPVHIEQKTGRVDRIASHAQRRLLSFSTGDDVSDEDLIQVTFPFVKESIEVLQVRKLCDNLNKFLESLHEVGSGRLEAEDTIDTAEALTDRSPIPEQIRARLKSPYVPVVEAHSPQLNQEARVAKESARIQTMSDHVNRLLHDYFGHHVSHAHRETLRTKAGATLADVRLTSARASGEMLLKAFMPGEEFSLQGMTPKMLRERMVTESWRTLSRTSAAPIANRCYQLAHDGELLIGEELNTYPAEIAKFFERFSADHNPDEYRKPVSNATLKHWAAFCDTGVARYGQSSATVSGKANTDHLNLLFTFGEDVNKRHHRIQVYECDGRCIFLATAASEKRVRKLSVDQIVRLTWERNANTDIAEFMLNDRGELVGRAVQPIDGLTLRKFAYCAYTLAVGTDRLEYLIEEPDLY